MPSVTLKAHFDGERIRLDEPYKLPANSRLLITLLEPVGDSERDEWSELSLSGLAGAYSDEEPD